MLIFQRTLSDWVELNKLGTMVMQQLVRPPESLNIEGLAQRGEQWKQFNRSWRFLHISTKKVVP